MKKSCKALCSSNFDMSFGVIDMVYKIFRRYSKITAYTDLKEEEELGYRSLETVAE